ncbi:hypothetical protein C8Q77DRAFT_1139930 [Trametes polyzona]|nr:hypothetical protein C8Q77DRAFT_1139930 [Trametes polyzona]
MLLRRCFACTKVLVCDVYLRRRNVLCCRAIGAPIFLTLSLRLVRAHSHMLRCTPETYRGWLEAWSKLQSQSHI